MDEVTFVIELGDRLVLLFHVDGEKGKVGLGNAPFEEEGPDHFLVRFHRSVSLLEVHGLAVELPLPDGQIRIEVLRSGPRHLNVAGGLAEQAVAVFQHHQGGAKDEGGDDKGEGGEEKLVAGHGTGESEGNSAFMKATFVGFCLLRSEDIFPTGAT